MASLRISYFSAIAWPMCWGFHILIVDYYLALRSVQDLFVSYSLLIRSRYVLRIFQRLRSVFQYWHQESPAFASIEKNWKHIVFICVFEVPSWNPISWKRFSCLRTLLYLLSCRQHLFRWVAMIVYANIHIFKWWHLINFYFNFLINITWLLKKTTWFNGVAQIITI